LGVQDKLFTNHFQVVLPEAVHRAVMIALHLGVLRFEQLDVLVASFVIVV
jgi:hypothetical protein